MAQHRVKHTPAPCFACNPQTGGCYMRGFKKLVAIVVPATLIAAVTVPYWHLPI